MDPVTITAPGDGEGLRMVRASFLPDRGLMLSELVIQLPGRGEVDLVKACDPNATVDDFNGNASFSFGGAFLIPYANRITGRPLPGRKIAATACADTVVLPANWSGKAPGAEPYAMHGLILDKTVEIVEHADSELRGRLRAGDFGANWPSSMDLAFHMSLTALALSVSVTAVNTGGRPTVVGIGWHPYFTLPSGDRRQAKLFVAASRVLEVADYDAVLPTGRILDLADTPKDFSDPAGRALGDLYLDDCFIDLAPKGGVLAALFDPAAGFGVQLSATGPIKAVQVYAPPDRAIVCVEPQFNWIDPLGAVWPAGTETGMVWLDPAADVTYAVAVNLVD
jgi:aldose 1-epimerase